VTTLPPSCAVVMKSGNLNFLEPSGPQACNGIALPLPLPLMSSVFTKIMSCASCYYLLDNITHLGLFPLTASLTRDLMKIFNCVLCSFRRYSSCVVLIIEGYRPSGLLSECSTVRQLPACTKDSSE
jgi:hypothetical protein